MTQEHPENPRHAVRCRDCCTLVYVENRDGALVVTCRCDEERTIQQIATMPAGWVA